VKPILKSKDIEEVSALTGLRYLDVSGVSLTDADLKQLVTCKRLSLF
jgi:hypothetical protein